MDWALSMALGLSLAAAAGLRVFVPLLALSLAANMGWVTPTGELAWLGDWPALAVLSALCLSEIGAYFLPWVDHALDVLATPLAAAAGTVAAAATFDVGHPIVQWLGAAIVGGGVASGVQLAAVATRGLSTITTGGVANPAINAVQSVGAVLLSVVAILLPVLALAVLVVVAVLVVRWVVRRGGRAGRTGGTGSARDAAGAAVRGSDAAARCAVRPAHTLCA
ncbi:MAG: DUF4126 domain-containing protein [Phycisphaerales bacterium]